MDERTDPRLIALARAGDKDAFGYLITRYQPMALRLAMQLTGNPDIACELVQEAMLQAYLSLASLRDDTRFKSWFYGIVLNATNLPHNLDFTQGTAGWSIQENAATGYKYGIDASVRYSGNVSLFLKAVSTRAEGQAFLVQTMAADAYRGKRVRFAAYVRGEKVAAWGGLLLLIHGSGGGLTFNSNVQQKSEHDLRIVGTKDWQSYEVVVDVPAASSLIRFGIGLMGPGQVWLADVRFEVVGEDVTATV